VLPVTARRLKRVPGRPTDVKDAEWIAQLWQPGLLAPGLVPPPSIGVPRDPTRRRTQLVRERATVVRRIPKVLEDAHIKLACVVPDGPGKGGRGPIGAPIAGRTDPGPLAEPARGRLRPKKPAARRGAAGGAGPGHGAPSVRAAAADDAGGAGGGPDHDVQHTDRWGDAPSRGGRGGARDSAPARRR